MIIIKLILLILAFFVTLLWVTKLMTDFASSFLGGAGTDEDRIRDASQRVILIMAMSVLWSILIIM